MNGPSMRIWVGALLLALALPAVAQTINLATNVRGNLSVNNLNGGLGATSGAVWTGAGAWMPPSSLGYVVGPASATSGDVVLFDGITGKLVKDGGALSYGSLAAIGANTILGNNTAGSTTPVAIAIGGCSSASSALIWTTSTGFGCNTSITAAAVPYSGLTGSVPTWNQNTTGNAATVSNATLTTALTNNGGAGTLTWPVAGATLTIPSGGGTLGTGAFAVAYSLPTATSVTLGGVKPDGTTITNTAGAISVTNALSSAAGSAAYQGYTATTWTPADASGAGLSFTVATAEYTRIGNVVYFEVRLAYPVTASAASAAISGLPVANASDTPVHVWGNTGSALEGSIANGATAITLYTAGFAALVANSALSGATLRISGFYFTS